MEDIKNSVQFKILSVIFIIISMIFIIYATVTYRGMYADGVSFMLDLLNNLSQGKIKFAIDLTHMRFFIQQLVQLPVIFAFFLGIKNKFALMGIYSLSQFLLPLLALIWHYNLTKRTGKINVFYWNLLVYCLIIIPYMIFSTVETIIGISFTFILWNYFISDIEYKKHDIISIIFLLIMMFATYEYVIFAGIIFFIAYFLYKKPEQSTLQKNIKKLIAYTSLIVVITNIIYMMLIPGEAGEILRFWEEFIGLIPHICHLNGLFSVVSIFLMFFYMFYNKRLNNILIKIFLVYIFAFIYLIIHPSLSVNPMWEGHFRVIPCIIAPFLFIWLIISDKYIKNKNNIRTENFLCIILMCGIFQTAWQFIETKYWNDNIQYLRKELTAYNELLYIPDEHEPISNYYNMDLRRYLFHSLYPATSILFSDTYKQKTLLTNYNEQYEDGNPSLRYALYIIRGKEDLLRLQYNINLHMKTIFWDVTDVSEALDKYNKEHKIDTHG